MENDFKTLYLDLSAFLLDKGILVNDSDYLAYCYKSNNEIKGIIVIRPHLNFKQKFFCLAHEVGHLFYMKKGNLFNLSKNPRSERQANLFAIQLLRLNDINTEDYKVFYSKSLKRKLKKAWIDYI